MILKCECSHNGQDKLNGKNMRVHNEAKGAPSPKTRYRCTVCGKEKDV